MYTPKQLCQQKERSRYVLFQNGGQKTNFRFRKKSGDQNLKKKKRKHFPKKIFNKIWLKVGEQCHEHIEIVEIVGPSGTPPYALKC